jgi:hypothetical protein
MGDPTQRTRFLANSTSELFVVSRIDPACVKSIAYFATRTSPGADSLRTKRFNVTGRADRCDDLFPNGCSVAVTTSQTSWTAGGASYTIQVNGE